jgi:hypothetical protein
MQSTAAINYRGWIIQPEPDEGIWFVVNRDGSFSDFDTLRDAKRLIDHLVYELAELKETT